MLTRIVSFVLVAAVAMFGLGAPVAARHNDKHCVITVHHPIGTDDYLPENGDVPTDLGLVKVFVNCKRR